ncbi:MAG TPA: ATP-binding protein, partial [Anaerolineales bacterium]|nr:ATP-binding protein [Anaerolineales bacterium]
YHESQTITPVFDKDGKLFRFITIKQDLTELIEARDRALEASRLKSQLLSRVSHELRTPLGGILGYAELLQHEMFGPMNEKQKQTAAQIIDSTNYLNTMVNELLDEAQLAAGNLIIRMAPFSPAQLMKKVEGFLSVIARQKKLVLKTSVSHELTELWGDEQRLQQILTNLIGNALKFTKSGEVQADIYSVSPVEWGIKVSDTGSGIPAEAQEMIFEPFRQVDNAITRENRGTGLGLSITKQLVEFMGGRIYLESQVGQGSTFTILLPRQKDTEKST